MNGVFLCVLQALELILHKLLAPRVRAQALEPWQGTDTEINHAKSYCLAVAAIRTSFARMRCP